jgi:type III secretory pathway component EscV
VVVATMAMAVLILVMPAVPAIVVVFMAVVFVIVVFMYDMRFMSLRRGEGYSRSSTERATDNGAISAADS